LITLILPFIRYFVYQSFNLLKRYFILIIALTLVLQLKGQVIGNLRKTVVRLNSEAVTLDTLSIIPSSFAISDFSSNPIDSKLYKLNYGKAELVFSSELMAMHDSLYISYRVFPMLFDREFYNRSYEQSLSPDSLMGLPAKRYVVGRAPESPFGDQIQTNGSIMRGIRFGNNQDLSVNSTMNLTLSGELSNNLFIEGAISDQTIPIQPDGTTRRVDEFDRIYLKVYRNNFAIEAGDIEMKSSVNNQLLNFSRNVQGLRYTGIIETGSDTLLVQTAMAVPKGKFARNRIVGQEGNQGPYRLQGATGEPYIIVLSGSERVYVDGNLMVRGEENHYTIDYNAAELTFTHKSPINRSSRISVEFEYSERSFARFNTFADVQSRGKKWHWNISAFSELDSRNQPFDQELTDSQKQHLALIGDNLSNAFLPQVDIVDFNPEEILYQSKDTVVNSLSHTIYVYSTNPSVAQYRVYFSFVGQGKGNYVPDFGTANGRVYRWVSPIGGVAQGSYEPIKRLVPPQKRQMIQTGVKRIWGEGSNLSVDYALSNTDLNTFSDIDNEDNMGHALQLGYAQFLSLPESVTQLGFGANLFKTTKGFRSIDRIRAVEFERDWNIGSELFSSDEQLIGMWAQVRKPKKMYGKISGESFEVSDWFKGQRYSTTGWTNLKLFNAKWDGSIAKSEDTLVNSIFQRAKIGFTTNNHFLTLGVSGEMENSESLSNLNKSLLDRSFSWHQIKASVATPDTLTVHSEVSYSFREDFKVNEGVKVFVGESQEMLISGRVVNEKVGSLSTSFGYRIFTPNKEVFSNIANRERTALARVEYSNRLFKGMWILSGGYELGSGLEPDAEYYFIEVPAGQGAYTWIDYNGNGIRELNEFEIANFSDEARFIRINIPGSKMVSVRNNALSIRSTLNPSALIKQSKGIVGFIGRFSNQTSFRVQQKNRFEDFWQSANPIIQNSIDTLVTSMSSNMRNSLAYNRANRKFGFEYIYLKGENKAVLANGFELKDVYSNRMVVWLGMGKGFTFKTDGEYFENSSTSELFVFRNFKLYGYRTEQSVKYQSPKDYVFEIGYRWNQNENSIGPEELLSHTLYLQIDLMFASRGAIMCKGSYVSNSYTGNTNSSVAYEMMKGLQPGNNMVWEVSIKRRLSNMLEIELGYNGRYSDTGSIVHSGAMQARALF
jgi:hypothetical protein